MTGFHQSDPLPQAGFIKRMCRPFQGWPLDIKGPDPTGGTCQQGQQQGVIAVAAGGVDQTVSRSDDTGAASGAKAEPGRAGAVYR